jgi:hypothetical protein
MKKTLFLTLAASLLGTTPLMAAADLFITGSTAFRSNVHDACTNMVIHDANYHEYTGTAATGGDSKTGNTAAQWTVTGTASTTVSNISGTLTIHALFTGSVQGIQTVESSTKLLFLDASGNVMTNTPTIAFSDVSSTSTPYPVDGSTYSEESVAIQPFVMVKAASTNNVLANISNITYDQLKYAIVPGKIPYSAWSNKSSDHNNYVYLLNRTKDSGTRRTTFAMENYGFSVGAIIYNWDPTNNQFYLANNLSNTAAGYTGYGVVGAAGNGNANLSSLWGPGYVGGGDIKTALGYSNSVNQSISYLSLSDAKGITGVNWSQVLSINGLWPTAAGSGIKNNGGTNDFSPICLGLYPHWAAEVVIYPLKDPSSISSDQDLNATQLGDQNTPGSILGVLDYQTKFSGGTAPNGSLENEIIKSQPGGATAIRLSDMTSSRASVGGTITP